GSHGRLRPALPGQAFFLPTPARQDVWSVFCRRGPTMLRSMLPSALLLLACMPAAAATDLPAVPREQPALHALAEAPSQVELRMTITRLVGFGTRHTLSDTKSDSRGIGAARRWVKSRFEAISKDCGGCIEVVTPSQVFTGKRAPTPT